MCAEQRVGVHNHGLGALGNDLVDSCAEPSRRAGGHAQCSQTPGGTAAFSGSPVRGLRGVVFVEQDGDATRLRDRDMQILNELAEDVLELVGDPGGVASRIGQAGDETIAYGVDDEGHHDRDRLRGALGRASTRRAAGDDHLDLLRDQFLHQWCDAVAVALVFGDAVLDVAALEPAKLTHALPESVVRHVGSGRSDGQHADAAHRCHRLGPACSMQSEQAKCGHL